MLMLETASYMWYIYFKKYNISIYSAGGDLFVLETSSYHQTQDRRPTGSIDLLNIEKSYLPFRLPGHNVSTQMPLTELSPISSGKNCSVLG